MNKIKPRPGFIYLIKSGKFYKIGQSVDVPARLKNMHADNPHELKLLKVWKTEHMACAEKYLHFKHSSLLYRNEWFKLTNAELIWLLAITNIDFMITSDDSFIGFAESMQCIFT